MMKKTADLLMFKKEKSENQNVLVPASTSGWLRAGMVALGMLGRLVRMASEQVDLGETGGV